MSAKIWYTCARSNSLFMKNSSFVIRVNTIYTDIVYQRDARLIRSTEVLRDALPCLFRLGDDLFERVKALFAAIVGCVIVVLTNDTAGVGKVRRGVKQNGARLFVVAACSTDFLRVGIDAERQTGVHNEPDVRPVDAETECVRRNDDRTLPLEKVFVHALALLLGELAVVGFRRVAAAAQPFGRALDITDGRAVNDSRALFSVLFQHIIEQRKPYVPLAACCSVISLYIEPFDLELDVGTLDREQKALGVGHMQALCNIAEIGTGCRCREGKYLRPLGQRVDERTDFGVGFAESAIDLRQDMCLVHDNAAYPCGAERGADVLAAKLLGREVEQAALLCKAVQRFRMAALAQL